MIWSWLINSRLGRMVSGFAVAVSVLLGLIAHQRRDARNDALRDAREKDQDNANNIRDRVSDVPEWLQYYDDTGFRD